MTNQSKLALKKAQQKKINSRKTGKEAVTDSEAQELAEEILIVERIESSGTNPEPYKREKKKLGKFTKSKAPTEPIPANYRDV